MHRFILHNGEIRDAGDRCLSPGQVGFLNGWGVFSTIRIVDGIPFAFERHWNRMRHDASLLHSPFPEEPGELLATMRRLIEANGAWNATMRVAVARNQGGPWQGPGIARTFELIGFTSDLTVWPESVTLALKKDARHAASEFSGVKVMSWSFNLTWNEQAQRRGFDEALLLNERGEVSECTSANIFAVVGGAVFTPPLSSGCLPGVTRALLLEEIAVPGISVGERALALSDLEAADGVFITSTTRDPLRVRAVEGLSIGSGGESVRRALSEALAENRSAYSRGRR